MLVHQNHHILYTYLFILNTYLKVAVAKVWAQKMQENKVFTYNQQGEKLVGIETLPDKVNGKLPAVVLAHGIGVNKNEYGMFDDLARRLVKAGFAIYRFDFSGCGESEGNIIDTTLTKLKGDLENILEFVKNQEKIDQERICILAQSFATACTVALKPKVKCIILLGSIAHQNASLAKYFGSGYNPTGISVKKKITGFLLEVEPKFWEDLKQYNLLEDIKAIHCPILLMHGSADDKIPPSETEEYFFNANQPKEKLIIDGANHGMEPKREEMYGIVANWLKKNLA